MQTEYYHRNLAWIFNKKDSKEYTNDFLELMNQRHQNVKDVCAQMMTVNRSHILDANAKHYLLSFL